METAIIPRPRLRLWFLYFLFITTMSTGLSFITPYYGGPDEPAHVVYLYNVFNGAIPMESDTYEVPQWLSNSDPQCWSGQHNQSAYCAGEVDTSLHSTIALPTTAANYPPLYYLLVGWPIKFLSGDAALRTIRFLSSLLFSALAAVGLSFLRTSQSPHHSDILAFLLITPSVYALAGFVQPQALEIGAAIALAGILIPLSHTPEETSTRLKWSIPITFLLVASRTTGMWWALMICMLVLITLRKNDIVNLIKKPVMWIFIATSALWCSLSLWWMLGTKDWYEYNTQLSTPHSCDVFSCIIPSALRPGHFVAMTAMTGWNDVYPPIPSIVLYWLMLAACVFFAFRIQARKLIVTSIFLVSVYIFSSVVMSISWVDIYGGPMWLGRYALPIVLAYFAYIADTIAQSPNMSGQFFCGLTRLFSIALSQLFLVLALQATLRFWSGIGNGIDLLHGPLYAPSYAQIGLVLCTLSSIALCVGIWYATRLPRLTSQISDWDSNKKKE